MVSVKKAHAFSETPVSLTSCSASLFGVLVGSAIFGLVLTECVGMMFWPTSGGELQDQLGVQQRHVFLSSRLLQEVVDADTETDLMVEIFGRFAGFLGGIALVSVDACIVWYFSSVYKHSVVDKIRPLCLRETKAPNFKHGLCAGCCWNDCHMCMHVVCCPQTRVAHTLAAAGLADYWIIVVLHLALQLGGGQCCASCAFSYYFRTEVRKRAGIDSDSVGDCFVAFCCTQCGQCQEALEIDDGTGAHASCCCKLNLDDVQLPPAGEQIEQEDDCQQMEQEADCNEGDVQLPPTGEQIGQKAGCQQIGQEADCNEGKITSL